MGESVRLTDLRRVLAAFERHGVRYALVGSMAMAAHGLARATEDIDFFVSPDEENIQRIRQALFDAYGDESVFDISAEDLAGAYPVVRYGPPGADTFTIDLIGRLGDAYSFDDIEAGPVEVGDLTARVATPHMLYVMKRDTLRPQDHVDAQALRDRFGLED
jgi:hypothetical protein